jgi:hypothetical protein
MQVGRFFDENINDGNVRVVMESSYVLFDDDVNIQQKYNKGGYHSIDNNRTRDSTDVGMVCYDT